eukprot:Gb_41578 [translate_table: standard]
MATAGRTDSSNYAEFSNASSNGFLIPGLPDQIATLCLVRIPRIYHSSLRSVNSQWKNFVESPSFYSLRKELGFTNPSLFMLPKCPDGLTNLPCWELDLNSHKSSKSLFHNNDAIIKRSSYTTAHVCVSLGRVVMLVGGKTDGGKAVSDVYMFDTLTKKWWRGPNMLSRRYRFGWGVIDGRLYVAGCSGGEQVGHMRQSEVYDPHSNTWSTIANLPAVMNICISFVVKGSLFVLGHDLGQYMAFSYNPLQDLWQPEEWLLNAYNTLPHVRVETIFDCGLFITTTIESDCIYFLEVISADDFNKFNSCSQGLHVSRYDWSTCQWKHVLSVHDQVSQFHVDCDSLEARFFGLNDKLLIMEHLEDAEENKPRHNIKVVEEDEVLRVSVLCPYQWFMAIVYA